MRSPGLAGPPPPAAAPRRDEQRTGPAWWIWAALIAAWLVIGVLALGDMPSMLDESIHAGQIRLLAAGDWRQQPFLTTFPTWHAVVAMLVALWPGPVADVDLASMRLASTLLAVGVLPVAYAVVRATGGAPSDAMRRTFMLALWPGVAPLMFILYTDVPALLPLLAAVALARAGRSTSAVGMAALATLVRQTNAVWIGWLALRRLEQTAGMDWPRRALALLPHALALAAFAAFVVVNGGVALGDHDSHPAGRLSLDNLHVGLIYIGIVLLPLQLAALPRIARGLVRQPLAALPALALALAFWFGFAPDHPYNRLAPDAILHNGLIELVRDIWLRAAAAMGVAWSLLTLQFTTLREPHAVALRIGMVLSVLPMWMVEPRYALPAAVLFLLLRAPESERIETLTAVWIAVLGGWLSAGYATYTMAL